MGLLVDDTLLLQVFNEEAVRNPGIRLMAVEDVIADVLHAVYEIVTSIASHLGTLRIELVTECAIEP